MLGPNLPLLLTALSEGALSAKCIELYTWYIVAATHTFAHLYSTRTRATFNAQAER